VAQERAAQEHASAERSGADGFGVEWPEELACAVVQHKQARQALVDAVSGAKGGMMAREEARELDRDAERGLRTQDERKKMKQSAANKREGARRVASLGADAAKKLDGFIRKYRPGCLARIAPVD
jgi:hypothetical protein